MSHILAVISDVHGNYPALQAVLAELDMINCEKIIFLGDVAGYYCMINECIVALRERNVLHVMGNHDYYLISDGACPRSNTANICLNYQKRILTARNRQWLTESTGMICSQNACFMHGGLQDPLDEYLYDVDESYFSQRNEQFFFSGHTHIQELIYFSEKVYCNPGSVGQPRDGDPRAAFALFSGERIEIRRVPYDIQSISSEMNKAGFDSYFYSNLFSGSRIGNQ